MGKTTPHFGTSCPRALRRGWPRVSRAGVRVVYYSLSLSLSAACQCDTIESSERSDRNCFSSVGHRPAATRAVRRTHHRTARAERGGAAIYACMAHVCHTMPGVCRPATCLSALRTRHNHTAPRTVPGASRSWGARRNCATPGSEGRQLAVAGAAKMRGVVPKDHGSSMDVVTPVQGTLIRPIFTPWL